MQIKIVSPRSQHQHTLDWGIRVKLSELKFPSELSNHLGPLQKSTFVSQPGLSLRNSSGNCVFFTQRRMSST